ncbi:SDR family NAD(P)-dependent oxidoreductase [Oceanobacillus picturae]|uniref:SDR family NAD(P)-dependent oxidoreductase n=1 Tax=Oceanobacillus picturae TaxID=171693 RepID=UPI000E688295|nr:glucose 1-dehydrogenase [Oceanobacillus picturae]RIU91359.1 SDR family oxidoreductase [Oceanobacillus picturae]
MPNLKDLVILVTGANRGQGKAIAEHLADLGGKVIVGARNYESAIEVVEEIGNERAYPVQLDVTKESSWRTAIKDIVDEFGRIDVLVNNAGILKRKPFTEISAEEYLELINVNQVGVFLGMQSVILYMEKQGKGAIVNNVSISAFSPIAHSSAYAASKAAVVAMSKSAAIELGPKGIRVNMIHPGGVNTDMAKNGEEVPAYYQTVPLGRIGEPIEIAKAVAFFASDESSYCTGAELIVDGGMTLGNGNDEE